MDKIFTIQNVILAVGVLSGIGITIWRSLAKLSATEEAARLLTVERYVGMAATAIASFAPNTITKWDDYLAAILLKVDETLKAQGADPLDAAEKAHAALQAAAVVASQKAAAGLPPESPLAPR